MPKLNLIVAFLALLWGAVWAFCLTYFQWGRWLALHRTWITVVVGVGMDLAILYFAIPIDAWWIVFGVFALSSVGIIARSLIHEFRDDNDL
jgi:uncharacterized membrane protein